MAFHYFRQVLLVGITTVIAAGCQNDAQNGGSPLPDIPLFDSSSFLPIVSRQLTQAQQQLDKTPRSVTANAHYAKLLQTYEQFEPSVTLYERAIKLSRNPLELLYLQAHAMIGAGRSQDAVKVLYRAYQIDATDPWVLMKLVVMQKTTDVTVADVDTAHLEALLTTHSQLPELHFALGKIYAMEGDFNAAVDHFEEVRKLTPPFGAVLYAQAMAHRRLGDGAQAERLMYQYQQYQHVTAPGSDPYLIKVNELNRSDLPLIRAAESLIKNGKPKQAIQRLHDALDRNPQSVAAHISLIGLYATSGQFGLAESHFEKANQLAPNRAKLFYNLGLMRLMQQRNVEAEQAFRQALEQDRNDYNAYVQLAVALGQQGRHNEAQGYLQRTLRLDPANRSARLQLAEYELKANRPSKVVELLSSYYDPPDGGSPYLLLLLVKAHAKLGDATAVHELSRIGKTYAERWNQPLLINQFNRQIQLVQ